MSCHLGRCRKGYPRQILQHPSPQLSSAVIMALLRFPKLTQAEEGGTPTQARRTRAKERLVDQALGTWTLCACALPLSRTGPRNVTRRHDLHDLKVSFRLPLSWTPPFGCKNTLGPPSVPTSTSGSSPPSAAQPTEMPERHRPATSHDRHDLIQQAAGPPFSWVLVDLTPGSQDKGTDRPE